MKYSGHAEEADDSKKESERLPDGRRDLGCSRIAQACREQRAQDPAAIHRKSWNQIKQEQPDVDLEKIYHHVAALNGSAEFGATSRCDHHEKRERDNSSHCGPSRGDHQLLLWFFRYSFQPRD